jgi:hypothetical protein
MVSLDLIPAAELLMPAEFHLMLLYAYNFRLLLAFFFPPTKMPSQVTSCTFSMQANAFIADPWAIFPAKTCKIFNIYHTHISGDKQEVNPETTTVVGNLTCLLKEVSLFWKRHLHYLALPCSVPFCSLRNLDTHVRVVYTNISLYATARHNINLNVKAVQF